MPNELKPCPFCGGEAIILCRLGKLFVTARHKENCAIKPDTWLMNTKLIGKQIKAWNRRADNG